MALSGEMICLTKKAGEDLSSAQYYLMTNAADGDLEISGGATEDIVGVLQNKPDAAGKAASYCVFGRSKCVSGAAVNEGDRITSDASGKGIATTTAGNTVVGVALTAVANADEVFEILVGAGSRY